MHSNSDDGHGVGERARVKIMLRHLVGIYQGELAANITPTELRAVRREMIGRDLSRSYVNDLIECLTRMFKWLATESMIPVDTYRALKLVNGLRRGENGVRETKPVLAVSDEVVNITLPHVPKVVADIARVQRLTGMRPAEACIIRPRDIDRSAEIWVYRPESHKTERFGKDRVVHLGPKAQEILLPYLVRDESSYCFQPNGSERHYEVCVYRRAIQRACDKAFPHPEFGRKMRTNMSKKEVAKLKKWQADHRWSPNQLRHAAATDVRKDHGLEAAQIILGHSRADVTQIYAERDMSKAIEVARQMG